MTRLQWEETVNNLDLQVTPDVDNVSLSGLLDLLDSLYDEIEAMTGLTPLWASEFRKDLVESLAIRPECRSNLAQ